LCARHCFPRCPSLTQTRVSTSHRQMAPHHPMSPERSLLALRRGALCVALAPSVPWPCPCPTPGPLPARGLSAASSAILLPTAHPRSQSHWARWTAHYCRPQIRALPMALYVHSLAVNCSVSVGGVAAPAFCALTRWALAQHSHRGLSTRWSLLIVVCKKSDIEYGAYESLFTRHRFTHRSQQSVSRLNILCAISRINE
jgi:hypothetical protein